MSTGIASTEERARINADESALIVTSGPQENDNRAFADWFRQLRFEGWQTFEQTPSPARTDEAWRFANVKALDLSTFVRPQPGPDAVQVELLNRWAGFQDV